MRFRPCIDFFRKGTRLLLTWNGKRKIDQLKITGTKVSYFFKIKINFPDEEDEGNPIPEDEDPNTAYQIWCRIFNFPYMPKRNPRKQETYRTVEEHIKAYVEQELKKKWINYPLDKYDVFEENEIFGGVPDGEEVGENNEVLSILEIKTVTTVAHRRKLDHRFYFPPLNYQLQLALYLYLRGLDTGYICICFLNPENWQEPKSIKLVTPLKKYLYHEKTFTGLIESWVSDVGDCPYEYTILEAYCNNFMVDNELLLFKVKIDMEKFASLLEKIKEWFVNHKKGSPGMTDKELAKILNKNKHW